MPVTVNAVAFRNAVAAAKKYQTVRAGCLAINERSFVAADAADSGRTSCGEDSASQLRQDLLPHYFQVAPRNLGRQAATQRLQQQDTTGLHVVDGFGWAEDAVVSVLFAELLDARRRR